MRTTYKYTLSYVMHGYPEIILTTEFFRDKLVMGAKLSAECRSHLDEIGLYWARPTSVIVDKISTERILIVEL